MALNMTDEDEVKPRPVVCRTLGATAQNTRSHSSMELYQAKSYQLHPSNVESQTRAAHHAPQAHRHENGHEEMLLKAITEATERTRRRAEQDLAVALERQAAQLEKAKEEAVRKAIDDTLMSVQDRINGAVDAGHRQRERGATNSKRELKAEKQRTRELEAQAKRLTEQVEQLKKMAADADGSHTATKQTLRRVQEQLRITEKDLQNECLSRKNSQQDASTIDFEEITESHDMIQKERDLLEQRLIQLEQKYESAVQNKVEELQSVVSAKSTSLSENIDKNVKLAAELEEAKQVITVKEEALQEAQATVKTLETQLKELDQVNWKLERELEKSQEFIKELEKQMSNKDEELEQATKQCAENLAKLKALQEDAAAVSLSTMELLQAQEVAVSEKERRQELEQSAKIVTEELQVSLSAMREECADALSRAQIEARKSMIADFAEKSVHKQLSATKKELNDVRERLAKMQKQAKQSLEREKSSVSKLQRELASTKKMLVAAQRGHKKAPSPKKHLGTNALDIVQAARDRVFGRPHEIITKKKRASSEDFGDLEEQDLWNTMDLNELGALDIPSPSAETWDQEARINLAIDAELSNPSGEIVLPPI